VNSTKILIIDKFHSFRFEFEWL